MRAQTFLCPVHQNGPPLLPQTSPLKHTYLHVPFEMSEHPVHPELHFGLATRCKWWHVRARSHHGATALAVQPPAHTPNTGKLPQLEAHLPTTISPPNLHGLPREWALSTSTHHDVSKTVRLMSGIQSIVTL